jgi:hypothetical protein
MEVAARRTIALRRVGDHLNLGADRSPCLGRTPRLALPCRHVEPRFPLPDRLVTLTIILVARKREAAPCQCTQWSQRGSVGALRHQPPSALQRPAAMWDRTRHPHGVMQPSTFGGCSSCAGSLAASLKRDQRRAKLAFFGEHELPTELSTRRVLLPQVRRMFEHMRQPELPTDFD